MLGRGFRIGLSQKILAIGAVGTAGLLVVAAIIGVVALAIALGLLALVLWKESLARKIGTLTGRIISAILKPFHKGPIQGLGDKAADTLK
jgi:cobalamin synthase